MEPVKRDIPQHAVHVLLLFCFGVFSAVKEDVGDAGIATFAPDYLQLSQVFTCVNKEGHVPLHFGAASRNATNSPVIGQSLVFKA